MFLQRPSRPTVIFINFAAHPKARLSVSSLCVSSSPPSPLRLPKKSGRDESPLLSFILPSIFLFRIPFFSRARTEIPRRSSRAGSPGGAVRAVMDGVLITASSTLERPRGGRNPSRSILTQHARAVGLNEVRRAPTPPPPRPSAPHFLRLTLIAAPSLQPNAPVLQRKTTSVEKPA